MNLTSLPFGLFLIYLPHLYMKYFFVYLPFFAKKESQHQKMLTF